MSPKESLGDLDAESAATLISAAADVSLIVDAKGVIRDVAFRSEELENDLDPDGAWLGKPWLDTVTVESHPKVQALLKGGSGKGGPAWRQVNHPSRKGVDVPVLYSVVRLGRRIIAVGRDLGAIAVLQQRLVQAQQSMERDHSRLRHAETRYRLLFQMSDEAVLILDAGTQRVLEANPAATRLFGESRKLNGRIFPDGFDAAGTDTVQALLAKVRAVGRSDEVRARLADGEREFGVSAYLFRQENTSLVLVRLASISEGGAAAIPALSAKLLKLVEKVPDALVVTDPDGRIIATNPAFLEMAQLATEAQAQNQPLDRWVGRPGVDLAVLTATLRQHGSVRLFPTTLRGEYGATADIEISAVSDVNGGRPCHGFAIRNVGRRLSAEGSTAARALPRSVEQLTELIGRVSLKDLVREATDVIEKLCIEAALELTGDNRASAAEILGLSRQSLYVKLRRYGLGDLAEEGSG
ncbi:MAG TPA: transcriptional regulator PpsR [Acidisphaera sp.]|nr:transcriptional regulator PpsR [Acidisphaera sp.]